MNRAVASAPAKVNLAFKVGPLADDGYHEVASAYLGLNLRDRVSVSIDTEWSVSVGGSLSEQQLSMVPLDESNLTIQAIKKLAGWANLDSFPPLRVDIEKHIPVAGGMAGGSADAAAALVAANELLGCRLTASQLQKFSVEIGSDVPFALRGGFALGTGRGENLSPLPLGQSVHLVFVIDEQGLSTKAVYQQLDSLRGSAQIEQPTLSQTFLAAAAGESAAELAANIVNDLQPVAISLRPSLADTIRIGLEMQALNGFVSGSGPTVAFICADADSAVQLQQQFQQLGHTAVVATDSPTGARIEAS